MQLENFENTDPHLLVGIVNTALRNEYADLNDLCASCDIDETSLRKRLEKYGYLYLEEHKRFG